MIGIIVALLLSYLLLWLNGKEHLIVLGFKITSDSLKAFAFGLIIMALFCTINLLGQSYFKGVTYALNPDFGGSEMLFSLWWTFKAAFFEELIFRGAILYIFIRRMGSFWGCLISAIAFGIYHWFSYGMFGRGWIPMLYVFLLTGAAGWMFAYAFAKTKTIYTPLGLHFGWIVINIVFLSSGPLGDSLFIPENDGHELNGWEQLMFFLWQALIVPGFVTCYLSKKYGKQT